jgi:AAA15 family ATPase/GTPase
MIVSFSISNFRSFASEETLSLVASNRLAGHEDHSVPIPDSNERVLRVAVLYGANGAGKSNFVKALEYFKSLALRIRRGNTSTDREPFRFGEFEQEPSCFDLQFVVSDKLYRLGFKVDDHRVREEWLVRVVGGRDRPLYERVTNLDGEVTVDGKGLDGDAEKVRALATVGGRANQSFLATVLATVAPSDYGEQLTEIVLWLRRGLSLLGPTGSIRTMGRAFWDDPDLTGFASEFLNSVSTGVDRLKVGRREISDTEVRGLLPETIASSMLRPLRNGDVHRFTLDDGTELQVEGQNGNHYFILSLEAEHLDSKGSSIPLALQEESDGTQRLLFLIPALHQMRKRGAVYVIDEIDRSLHPMLVRTFMESFLRLRAQEQCQIIVTTHESSLLDQELFRRDEIWFAEKDSSSATRLYSLMDFKVRSDLEIRKHYLQGRFGAVPFIGGVDRLRGSQDTQA